MPYVLSGFKESTSKNGPPKSPVSPAFQAMTDKMLTPLVPGKTGSFLTSPIMLVGAVAAFFAYRKFKKKSP